jgi:Saxitoxin biosynthesis operon protein SxtJ
LTSKLHLPTDRSFGLTFAAVFSLLAAWLAYRDSVYWLPCLVVSAVFALLAFTFPRVLHPLNVAWMWIGSMLNRVVSPIVLGIIFFGMFMPVAFLFRLRGRDAMNRSFTPSANSYWIHRAPPGPDAPRSFPRQF